MPESTQIRFQSFIVMKTNFFYSSVFFCLTFCRRFLRSVFCSPLHNARAEAFGILVKFDGFLTLFKRCSLRMKGFYFWPVGFRLLPSVRRCHSRCDTPPTQMPARASGVRQLCCNPNFSFSRPSNSSLSVISSPFPLSPSPPSLRRIQFPEPIQGCQLVAESLFIDSVE